MFCKQLFFSHSITGIEQIYIQLD